MSDTINKVVLAGATGNLGPPILEQLLAAGFQITVFTRQGSTHTFPSGVSVTEVDYDSVDSLAQALQGQDAVVSTLGNAAQKGQLNLIEAAAKAGVKRFLPSEFGSNTVNEKAAALPIYADKIAAQKALAEQAKVPGGLTYTILLTGPFLDWCIEHGLIVDPKNRRITLYDGGERVFSATTLPTIGKAVAAVLRKPAETENRPVYVQETAKTLRKVEALAKKATGQPESWTVSEANVDDLLAEAYAELKKPNPNPRSFGLKFIVSAVWGEGTGAHFTKTDNDLLGIKELTDEELEALVARYV